MRKHAALQFRPHPEKLAHDNGIVAAVAWTDGEARAGSAVSIHHVALVRT